MGLMHDPTSGTQIVLTPHPITCEGQRHFAAEFEPGEKLGAFLRRTVPDWDKDHWEVRVNGVVVPVEVMERVRPKAGTRIEVRGAVGRQALYIVAMMALTYFTFGGGAIAGWSIGTSTALGTAVAQAAVFMAGSILVNKVLGPKVGKAGGDRQQDPVHSLTSARNRMRPYEPPGLLFGRVRIAPDVLSKPYTRFENEQQYLSMILTPGINVGRVEALYNGDALLSSFDGVQVWHSGFSGMPEQPIPLYSDADSLAGGDLTNNGPYITRTTSPNTRIIEIDLEGVLYDVDKHGTIHGNSVPVQMEYRAVGATGWQPLSTQTIANGNTRVIRRTFSYNVTPGQYDVRVRLGQPTWNDGSGKDECRFTWTTLRSVQSDTSTRGGLPAIGIKMLASGQLSGSPDEIRCVAVSEPIPVWKGSAYVTEETSNPGAQILAYARGFELEGELVAGMGLPEEMIDEASLKAFALHCAANGYTFDFLLDAPRSHDEMLESLARAGFGQVSWAGGRLSVVWAAAEQPLSGTVNMATIKRGSFQVDYNLANAADGVEVTYFDSTVWEARTLRIPAPGVTTMLNPAQLQLEGVTSEEHAAQMGRWHLAQSLYQRKDIAYSTDLEHLSYRRLSMLALQHDLTQWGYGGRVRSASVASGVVTLTLDEEVPPPAGNAFIGLRIPGERSCRVFGVAPFTDPTDTIQLVGPWPSDAALPGDSAGNPAHDTIWIYDFKQTPGLRVRVVSVEPESDLKGARVAVVAEPPEFWHYVETGEYIPAAPNSLLRTRPVASQLQITEQQVTQGDTVFTELSATFEVDGPYARASVFMAEEDGVLEEVAQTTTRSASWRIPRAGTYTILVRPFSPDGNAGISASIVYTTLGADAPPVLVDLFDVEQRSGGVRLYTWGWLADTIQSADFAGVEIRYVAGTVASPDWEAMTPVGETGYFTAPFEAVMPEAGTWTFACRSRNTAGRLSTGMRVITRTLAANLGQVIGGIEESLDEITQRQVDEQMRLDQEIADRLAADLATAAAAGADATAKANAALASAMAAVAALEAQLADITGAPEWDVAETYEVDQLVKYDGALYRALVQTTGDQPDISPTGWEKVGDYASLGEAVAAALSMSTANASEIEAAATRIDTIVARLPAGSGALATQAMVTTQVGAIASELEAEAERIDALVARMPGGTGLLATAASVSAVESASVTRDNALASRTTVVESRLSESLMLVNGSFESGGAGWATSESSATAGTEGMPAGYTVITGGGEGVSGGMNALQITAGATGRLLWNFQRAPVSPDEKVFVRLRGRVATLGGTPPTIGTRVRVLVRFYNASGGDAGLSEVSVVEAGVAALNSWQDYIGNAVAPAGAVSARIGLQSQNAQTAGQFNIDSIEMEREGAVGGAISTVVSDHSTRITQTEQGLVTQGQLIQSVQTEVAGKASTSALNALSGQVSAVQGGVEAVSQALTTVRATMGGGGNLLPNSDFGFGLGGWTISVGGGTPGGTPTIYPHTTAPATLYIPQERGGFFLRNNGAGAPLPSGVYMDANSTGSNLTISVEAGKRYIGSIYLGAHRCVGQIFLQWLTSAGDHISYTNGTATSASGVGGTLANFGRVFAVGVAPANAAFLRLKVRATGNGSTGADSYLFATSPMVEEAVSATQNVPSPYSVGSAGTAQVTQQAIATANSVDGRLRAKHTVALDVNGLVSGTVNENDGTRSSFSILATVFRVISTLTGMGMEWQDGYLRIWKGAAQLIIGHTFGAGDLVFWYGPNVGAAACTKANGTIWFDTAGSAYFGGTLSAGVLKNAARSTAISASAFVEVGPFSTNGGQKVVNWGMSYVNGGLQPTNPGSGSTSGTLVLERSLNGGTSWTTVSSLPITGNRTSTNEGGGNYRVDIEASASGTFTDNNASTSNFMYRVRITGASGFPANISGNLGEQSTYVISVEQ